MSRESAHWLPLVSLPELAMDRMPGESCFRLKSSSCATGLGWSYMSTICRQAHEQGIWCAMEA